MKLTELDLGKAQEHQHPDIDAKDYFLAEVAGELHFGQFTKQWYGWNFDCGWGASGMQFDAPGFNSSRWQRLWRLDGYVPTKGRRSSK